MRNDGPMAKGATHHRLRAALGFRVRRARADAIDAVEAMSGRRNPLMPPRRLLTGDYSDYQRIGEEFLDLFVRLCRLRPDEAVLDIGCGPGRMAVPLTGYLSGDGSYRGFDIVTQEVRWCQSHITPAVPELPLRDRRRAQCSIQPEGSRRSE
jgi:hypothetical protein